MAKQGTPVPDADSESVVTEVSPTERMRVGDDLYIVMVDPRTLREQDVNAQVMQPADFERLTDNVRQRGQLESLPYCWQGKTDGPIEIVSGHHRIRAAVAADIPRIPILLDVKPMRRSLLVAKQIAHNQLAGTQDAEVLRVMLSLIDDLDDLIVTGLPDDMLPVVQPDDTALHVPAANFDWRTVTFTFLPSDLDNFTACLDSIDRNSELVGVGNVDVFERFSKAIVGYGHLRNIRNFGVALLEVTRIAEQQIAEQQAADAKVEFTEDPA